MIPFLNQVSTKLLYCLELSACITILASAPFYVWAFGLVCFCMWDELLGWLCLVPNGFSMAPLFLTNESKDLNDYSLLQTSCEG